MTDRELMQMALDALESWQKTCLDCGRPSEELGRASKPLQALRERLAIRGPELCCQKYETCTESCTPRGRYLAKREWAGITWVGLTDEEIYDYADKFLYQHGSNYGIKSFGKAIEAKLKEKNT